MAKLTLTNNLNWIEHYNTLTNIDNKRKDKYIEGIKEANIIKAINKTNNNMYLIAHNSTKKEGYYQISFFMSIGTEDVAMSDIEVSNKKELYNTLWEYRSYTIEEVA